MPEETAHQKYGWCSTFAWIYKVNLLSNTIQGDRRWPARNITLKCKYKIQLERRWPAGDITLKYKYKIQGDSGPARDSALRTMDAIALDPQ